MNKKYLFGGAIVVVFLGLMIFLLTQTNISYEENFSEIMSSNRTFKATGVWVKEKAYEFNAEQNTFTFYLKDKSNNEMKVIYNGAKPQNFDMSEGVVATGVFKEGVFHAKDILTKCPSKYESQMTNKKS